MCLYLKSSHVALHVWWELKWKPIAVTVCFLSHIFSLLPWKSLKYVSSGTGSLLQFHTGTNKATFQFLKAVLFITDFWHVKTTPRQHSGGIMSSASAPVLAPDVKTPPNCWKMTQYCPAAKGPSETILPYLYTILSQIILLVLKINDCVKMSLLFLLMCLY